MALQGRLLSVLQHLATSHRQDASLAERVGVLQASLFLVAKELPIKRLASELLHLSKLQLFSQVLLSSGDELSRFSCTVAEHQFLELRWFETNLLTFKTNAARDFNVAMQEGAEQDDELALECAAAAVFVCEEKSGQGEVT